MRYKTVDNLIKDQENETKSNYYNVRFETDPKTGLTQDQVDSRMMDGLFNKETKHYTKSVWEIIKTNVFTFFNIFLYVIAAALIAVKKYTSLFFMVVQFGNIMIGIIQDVRAKIAIEKMSVVTESHATVIRDGETKDVKSNQLVLDDAVVIKNGKQIVVDGRIIEGTCEVNESMITGESDAIKKSVGDKVYAGSYVTAGKAVMRVRRVGDNTFIQRLQKKAKIIKKPKSELLNSLNLIFRWISFIIIPMAILIFVGNWIQSSGTGDTYARLEEVIGKTAGSLVAMIPAGMFLLTSMTLTVGVINLSKKRTFVQDLYSIESLARVDVICVDKTGTLTDGTMNVEEAFTFNGMNQKSLNEIVGSYLRAVEDDNQTARALTNAYPINEKYMSTKRLPFSSDRKYSAASLKGKGTFYLGAPDYLFKGDDAEIKKIISSNLKNGKRVLMLCHSSKELDDKGTLNADVKPVAVFVLKDHIRDTALSTINWFQENEVDIKVISGDNPESVSEIAKQCGIKHAERYISLEGMTISQVQAIARDYVVFGRVTPEQKAAIIRTLRRHKYTAAMVGDGVNDILALKEADCSIAMASGSEAAKDAAHIVLLDSDFSVLPDVVAEGRRVINNLQNVSSLFLVKTVFSMLFSLIWMVVMFTSISFGVTDLTYPFETQHLYVWEFFSIGFGAFFLALQPNRKKISGSFASNVLRQAIPAGVLIALMVLCCYIFKAAGLFGFENGNTFLAASCLVMYIMSYVILFRNCIPLNWYRGVLFIVLCAFAIGLLMMNEYYPGMSDSYLGFKFAEISSNSWVALVIMLLIGAFLYAAMNFSVWLYDKLTEQKRKEILKMIQERKDD